MTFPDALTGRDVIEFYPRLRGAAPSHTDEVLAFASIDGAAGVVIYSRAGDEGIAGFLVVVATAFLLTGVCLGLAALIAAGNIGRRRSRALAIAQVVWLALPFWAASRRLSRADI